MCFERLLRIVLLVIVFNIVKVNLICSSAEIDELF